MTSSPESFDTLILLGATATGKTALAVELAHALHGEIISADSRQVYRGLDIGSGKDLDEYGSDSDSVPYHLIDCVDLDHEFSVFEFQKRAYDTRAQIRERNKLPIIVGGTGLYLSAFLQDRRMVEVPENPELHDHLDKLSQQELVARLKTLKTDLHNSTDTQDTDRLIRAIEIEEYTKTHPPEPAPEMNPLILGIRFPRPILHERIAARLKQRLNEGMVEEVEALLADGIPPERLITLGLEYRFITEYLRGTINNKNDLFQKLLPAIKNFAKRQESWFRRMEKEGRQIHWLENLGLENALAIIRENPTL
jgi:tRNA dimethylallyltransferase